MKTKQLMLKFFYLLTIFCFAIAFNSCSSDGNEVKDDPIDDPIDDPTNPVPELTVTSENLKALLVWSTEYTLNDIIMSFTITHRLSNSDEEWKAIEKPITDWLDEIEGEISLSEWFYDIEGLNPGSTYDFRVASVYLSGAYEWSNTDTVTICPKGHEGTSCDEQMYPSKITIDWLFLYDFNEGSSGDWWDTQSPFNSSAKYPDVYIALAIKEGVVKYFGETFPKDNLTDPGGDAAAAKWGWLNWEFDGYPPYQISYWHIRLYDYDIVGNHPLIATIPFILYTGENGFPADIWVTSGSNRIRLCVKYEWE